MDIKTRVAPVVKFLANQKYELDVYQRGYVWTDAEIRKFLTDLEDHARDWLNQDNPPSWFLGTVLVEKRVGRNFLVDGQQRVVTLGLLLLALHPFATGSRRAGIELALRGADKTLALPVAVGRYQLAFSVLARGETAERFAGRDTDQQRIAGAFFQISDWVKTALHEDDQQTIIDAILRHCLLNVVTVSDTHLAFRLFNSLNARGKPLSIVDTLKSVLLTDVEEHQRQAIADAWDAAREEATKDNGEDPTLSALRSALIARAAPEAGPGTAFAASDEVRLIRDNPFEWLSTPQKGAPPPERIARDLPFFIRLDAELTKAERTPTPGLEALHFAVATGLPHDHWAPLVMAPLADPAAPGDINAQKTATVLAFLDIVAARLAWRRLALSPAQTRDALAGLAPLIRDADPESLALALSALLEGHFPEGFTSHNALTVGGEGMSHDAAHALLARLTAQVETFTQKKTGTKRTVGTYPHFMAPTYRVTTVPPAPPTRADAESQLHTPPLTPPNKPPLGAKHDHLGAHILVTDRLARALDAEPAPRRPMLLAQADNRLALTAADCPPEDPRYDKAKAKLHPPPPDGPVKDGVDIALRDDAYAALAQIIWSPDRISKAAAKPHKNLVDLLDRARPTMPEHSSDLLVAAVDD